MTMNRFLLILLSLFVAWSGKVSAELTIEIIGGQEAAQPIAIVPFGVKADLGPLPEDLAQVIAADLGRTGRFKPLPRQDMPAHPQRVEEVNLRDWRLISVNNLVVGQVQRGPDGLFEIDFALFDVYSGEQLANMSLQSAAVELRHTAHRIADIIFERLTGNPGAFTSRLAYVTSEWSQDGERITLKVADADGHNPQTIVSSKEPIMSPAWSPDGRRLAYVSFEEHKSAIFVQELTTGRRERVAAYPGINSSPAWSPDGNRLALTLSKDGNPEIYLLDLLSRALHRLTDSPGIDTEPAWSPDGRQIAYIRFPDDGPGPPETNELWLVGVDGQGPRRLGQGTDLAPFSADWLGPSALLVANGEKPPDISLRRVDAGSGAVQKLVDQVGWFFAIAPR